MSLHDVRLAIASVLSSVADIGRVHAYQRYATSLRDLSDLYRSPAHNQLRGWNVSRASTREIANIQGRTVEITTWRIIGAMALDDAGQSEIVFDDLVESVRNAFAQDETLGGTVAQCSDPNGEGESGIQVDQLSPGKFADVLCHLAQLSLMTVRYLDRSIP